MVVLGAFFFFGVGFATAMIADSEIVGVLGAAAAALGLSIAFEALVFA